MKKDCRKKGTFFLKIALLFVMSFFLLFSTVFAAEIINLNPEILIPSDIDKHISNTIKKFKNDRLIAQFLYSVNKSSWNLPPTGYLNRFHIISPDKLFFTYPKGYGISKKSERPIDLVNLFSKYRIRYTDLSYQALRTEMEQPVARKIDKKLKKKLVSGWKWDISKDVKLILRGSQNIDLSYGFDRVNQNLKEGSHVKRVGVNRKFKLKQDLNITLIGRIGPKISVSIDHNSKREENLYDITYKGRKHEVVKEVKAGNVALNIPGSKYVVYSGGSKSAFGIKGVIGTKKFKMQAVLSMTKGITETKSFKGQKKETKLSIRDVNYTKHKYYQLPDTSIDNNSLRVYLTTTDTNNSIDIDSGIYKQLVSGTDYSFNETTGELNMTKPVTYDQNLIITYKKSSVDVPGLTDPYNTSSSIVFQSHEKINYNSVDYLYLKRIGYYSRFERKGFYNLGYGNIDITRGFEFYIVNTSDGVRSDDVQFADANYRLDSLNGIIQFYDLEPFQGKNGITEALYHSSTDPISTDSVYSLYIVFLHKVDSFQLRFNIIPGSESIKVNNIKMKKGVDYNIDYMTGILRFIIPINENDTIVATYEYKPYSSSLQRTLFGLRTDFNIIPGIDLGATMVYSGGQKPTGAPTPENPPDSKLIFDIDGKIDFIKLFGIQNKKWTAKIEGEFAYSIHDKNTVDKAILADMEGDVLGYAITRSEELWKLGSPSPNIESGTLLESERGRLLYRDYRDYKINDTYSLKSYNWDLPSSQIRSYSAKPGPYTVKGGRNESTSEISENSIVLEYDFTGGKKWVSTVCSVAGAGGIDLSRINQFLISLKHQSFTSLDGNGNAVYEDAVSGENVSLYFELGNLDEDSDGDLVFDKEETIGSGGYLFNPASGISTYIGGGRKSSGNGTIDSEDLNRDNVFQTNEESVLFPSPDFTDNTNLIVPTGTDWQEYNFFIQNLGDKLSILSKVSAVRITVVGPSEQRGRLIIDRAYFKGSQWDILNINGEAVSTRTTNLFSASILSTKENAVYKTNRIHNDYSGDFENLHGDLSKGEEEKLNEKCLQIKYDFPGSATVTNATVNKIYNNNMDFTIYKKFIVYILIKEKTGHTNEYFIYRLCNAADRYYEWKIPMSTLLTLSQANVADTKKWHKLIFYINPDNQDKFLHVYIGDVDYGVAKTTIKSPNLREVNRVAVGVDVSGSGIAEVSKGEIWINEIHLTDDSSQKGYAYNIRAELGSSDKNLLKILGVPIFGPFSIKLDVNKIGFGFKSIGETGDDQTSLQINTSAKFNLFNYFNLSIQYTDDKKRSDDNLEVIPLHLQYATTNVTYKHLFSYKDPRGYFPSINHSYSRNVYKHISHRIDASTNVNDTIVDSQKYQYSESASVSLDGKLPLGFSHSYKISDSYYLTDISIKSNEIEDSWFTNNTSQSYITFSKNESFTLKYLMKDFLGFRRASLSVSGTIFKTKENYNKTISKDGLRNEFQKLEDKSVWNSYSERMEELLSGVNNISDSIDGTNANSVSEGRSVNFGLKNLGFFSLVYKFTRSSKDSNFVESTNLIMLNNNATTAKSTLSTSLNFDKFFIRNLSATFTRDFSYAQTSGEKNLEQIWDKYKKGFFALPFYYLNSSGNGRYKDVDFVKKIIDSEANTYVKLRNNLTFSGKLDYGKTFLRAILPEHFTYSLAQYTAKDLSSLIQNRAWSLSITKNFPVKKLGFWIFDESSAKGKRVQDLIVKTTIARKYDYNNKTIANTYGLNCSFGVRWSRFKTFNISYALSKSYSYQSIYSSDNNYVYMGIGPDTGGGTGDSFGDLEELTGGVMPGFTELPPFTKYKHTIKIDFTFPTHHKAKWNLFGLKIPIDTHWKHKNTIELNFDSSKYDKNRSDIYSFNELFDRTFYLKLTHSLDYDFSKSWNGILYVTVILEKWKLIRPDTDGKSLNEEDFGISFGMEIGLKMIIRF